jgi:hypothetical protein
MAHQSQFPVRTRSLFEGLKRRPTTSATLVGTVMGGARSGPQMGSIPLRFACPTRTC